PARPNIHLLYPYPGTADHAQFRAGVQNVRRDFGLAPHHQRAERRNDLDKFALAQASLDRNLQRVIAREFVHSALRNRIGNKNLWRSHGSLTFRRSIRSQKYHYERREESNYFLNLCLR